MGDEGVEGVDDYFAVAGGAVGLLWNVVGVDEKQRQKEKQQQKATADSSATLRNDNQKSKFNCGTSTAEGRFPAKF